MSPVSQFEESARAVWRSDLGQEEKRTRLKAVRKAIVHYIERLDEKRMARAGDPWRARSFDRVRNYLTQLAADVEELALECERATSGKSLSAAKATYVA